MSEPILAVDFGTTTSAAVLVAGVAEEPVYEPSGHGRTWPSAVSLEGDTLLVGTTAEHRKRKHPTLYRAEFKPELGQAHPMTLGERSFAVTELVTAMLSEIRKTADQVSGTVVTRAVLTVPANYGPHDQRNTLMLEAAAAAGFDTVELLAEPVAAALAPIAGAPLPPGSLILVYDFGGGTFDTALVRVGAKGNEVLGYAAVNGCGGRDLDSGLYRVLADSAGKPLADLLSSPRSRVQLTAQANQLKHQLTAAATADDYFGDSDIPLEATRDQLNELTAPLLDRTIQCVKDLLTDCHVGLDDVNAVLLAGGVTRMPIVAQTVTRRLGRPLQYAKSPELAVVQGAARFAGAVATRFAVPSKRRIAEHPLRWRIPGDSAMVLAWRVSPGEVFTSGRVLGQLRLIDGAIWELRANRPGRIRSLHAAPGSTVYTGDWLVTTETLPSAVLTTPTLLTAVKHRGNINCVSFSPDGKAFATGGDDTYARIWNAGTGRQLKYVSHDDQIFTVAYSPYKSRLATGSRDKSARIWDVDTGRQLSRFECDDYVTGVSFSADGRHLATAADDLIVWDTSNGTPSVSKKQMGVRDVCFSPDGAQIASAHSDHTARILDVASTEVITQIEHDDAVHCVAFSPDGDRFATGCKDGSVGIWDATTGEQIASATHRTGEVNGIAFSPDSSHIATAGDDSVARVWDAVTGEELTHVEHKGQVYGVAFSPDGRLLATAGWDEKTQIWQIRP